MDLNIEIPDNMVHKMSQSLGTAIMVRGKILMPTTFGNTTAGNSVNSIMWAQNWLKFLNDLEKNVEDKLDIIKTNIEKEIGRKVEEPLDIHLIKIYEEQYELYETKYKIYLK